MIPNYSTTEVAERLIIHEMARDEAQHGKAFKGLLERYFNE